MTNHDDDDRAGDHRDRDDHDHVGNQQESNTSPKNPAFRPDDRRSPAGSRATNREQSTLEPPPPPDDLGDRGRALWVEMTAARVFTEPHTSLLHEFARVADRLESLDTDVKVNGTSLPWGRSGVRANPALIEARQQQIVFNRLAAALEVAEHEEKPQPTASERMQRRRGNR